MDYNIILIIQISDWLNGKRWQKKKKKKKKKIKEKRRKAKCTTCRVVQLI